MPSKDSNVLHSRSVSIEYTANTPGILLHFNLAFQQASFLSDV